MKTPRLSFALLASSLLFTACSARVSDSGAETSDALGTGRTDNFQNGVSPSALYTGTQDSFLEEATSNTIRGARGTVDLDHNEAGKRSTGLLKFALNTIPPGSKVTAVQLTLDVVNATANPGFNVYEGLRAWSEYQATWKHPTGDTDWNSEGALGKTDHGSKVVATINPNQVGTYTLSLNADGLALVQKWVDDPSTNHGFVIPSGSNNNAVQFTSTENPTASKRPKLSVTYNPAPVVGTGLTAEYFSNETLSGAPDLVRKDATLNFNWAKTSPGAPVGTDHWSARWTGTVVPQFSETYTFSTVSDDGIRVWVNGKALVDDWTSGAARANSGSIALTAGQHYDLKVEYYDHTSVATAQLLWSSKSQPQQVIPAAALYPATLKGAGNTPIKYVVVIVKENHTLDNYFMDFPGAATSRTAKLSNGTVIVRPRLPDGPLNRDFTHSHHAAVTYYAGGKFDALDKVDGTVKDDKGHTDYGGFGYHSEAQIPNYWQYARNFVLADHFFSTTLGNSFAGHFAIDTGFSRALSNPARSANAPDPDSSDSKTDECTCGDDQCTVPALSSTHGCYTVNSNACWDAPSVVNELPAGYTWAEYGWTSLRNLKGVGLDRGLLSHFKTVDQVVADIKSGHQPNLMFAHLKGGISEHPPQDVCPGENATVGVINAIMESPHWKETAILVTWDDWGGGYDSVSPEAPQCSSGDYAQLGFRVPLLVISPYAKKSYVMHGKASQTSIIKLVEDLWGLPRMQQQSSAVLDHTSGSLLDAFDFSQTPRAPLVLNARSCK